MDLKFQNNWSVKEFILENQDKFEQELLEEAINVKDKIEEIREVGNIHLLKNAKRLVLYIIEQQEDELIAFAKQEGIAWARVSLTLAFKLEWIHAIRRTLWHFLKYFDSINEDKNDREKFFEMEKNINDQIDQFLSSFFISYSAYKDELLEKQRKLVENLSVPIIPIDKEIRILPLIGSIDYIRINTITEKVLSEIESNRIQTLIMDLSGITPMEEETIMELRKIIDAIEMMGCQTILTGLRSEIVRSMVKYGFNLGEHAKFKGTLQSALKDVFYRSEKKNPGF